MDFFSSQDQARRTTRRLVIAYILATAAIVVGVTAIAGFALFSFGQVGYSLTPAQFVETRAPLLGTVAVATSLFILGSSLYKTSVLSSGGGRVAVEMGGTLVPTDVQDPLRRRLRNVVEEMAIASGVPVPEIYVLEAEQGINAFAAGFSPSDAAIAVTRGTLQLLDRDELQGVIAHEFSHIMNGDMRLNIRLMGVLFGIMVLGLIGRLIVRGGYHTSIVSSRRDRGAPVALMIGLGLVVLGGIGVFFARLIKAGVSRQREFLADASAVQFTRQTEGIANALKKIGGYSEGSRITAKDPEEVSHMLFGSGSGLLGLFATHPPLIKRIQALDPGFTEANYPSIDPRQQSAAGDSEARAAGFAGDYTSAFANGGKTVLADAIVGTLGNPEQEHVRFAQDSRRAISAELYDAAHSSELAYLLAITLVLDRSGNTTERQFSLLQEQLGDRRCTLMRRYFELLSGADREFRLPLLEISFPALKRRPTQELAYLVSLTSRLIELDGEVELYEYCFYRIMMSNLGQAVDPSGSRAPRRSRRRDLQTSAIDLLRILAHNGHDNAVQRAAAFAAGRAVLGPWAESAEFTTDRDMSVAGLDRCLDVLLGLNTQGQKSLVRALSATAAHDGNLAAAEAELIRAVCATLNYPLPPILVRR